eukprot:349824-Chlamydomonas_euryale.AAC.3
MLESLHNAQASFQLACAGGTVQREHAGPPLAATMHLRANIADAPQQASEPGHLAAPSSPLLMLTVASLGRHSMQCCVVLPRELCTAQRRS